MKAARRVSLLFCAALAVSCVSPGPQGREAGPLRIGFLADLSGLGALEADDALRGLQLRVRVINSGGGIGGRLVELVTADSGTGPAGAVSGYLRLAREGWVSGIIGPWSPNACLAVAPVAEAVGVPVVSHCPDYRAVTPELVPGQPASHPRRFFFLSRPASLDSGFLLAGFAARALGLVSLAAVARADLPVSSQQAAGFELFAKGKGVRAVASVVTGADPQQIESAIQQARQAGAEGILLGLAVAPLLPSPSFPVVPGLVAVLLGDEWWPGARPAPAVARPTLAYGLAYDDPAYPEVASFASAYRREYGRGPGFHALAAVDDLALLLDAAWRSGSLQPHDVRDALEQTEGLPGLSGRITMDRSAHRPLPMPATVFRFDPSGPVAVREGYLP